jgi:hypothetical protein
VPKLVTWPVSWGFVVGSGCSSVFVDHAAKDAVAVDRGVERDGVGGVVVGWAVLAALVRAVIVIAAPRGAALYRSRSGQGREEVSLDLMADPGSER